MLVHLTQTLPERRPHAAYAIPNTIWRFTRQAWQRYINWNSNRIALQALCSLDDRMLKDIGITRPQLRLAKDQGVSHATYGLQRHARGQYGYEV
ncbi:DUF1127 domain-containing protein [Neorhizobium sp. DAR64861/K0K2]|uniref:DUF1127 domain-containing protein n=1 Tax=unclassified Neorhizobium TaxID=2629175 RepID=UPI003D2A10C6